MALQFRFWGSVCLLFLGLLDPNLVECWAESHLNSAVISARIEILLTRTVVSSSSARNKYTTTLWQHPRKVAPFKAAVAAAQIPRGISRARLFKREGKFSSVVAMVVVGR